MRSPYETKAVKGLTKQKLLLHFHVRPTQMNVAFVTEKDG